jgi:hypothetical protein
MGKQASVTFNTDLIHTAMEELHLLDGSLINLGGTASERIAAARASVNDVLHMWTPNPIVLDGDANTVLHDLTLYKEDIDHTIKEMVDWCLAQQRQASSGERSVLVEARDSLVKKIKSLSDAAVLVGVWDEDDVPAIPNKPGARGATSSATPTHAFQYYTIIDGRRRNQSNHQNSLSSVAYYHGAKLLKLDDRPGVDSLKQALTACGCDYNIKGSEWQQQLPGGIVGLEVIALPSSEDAATSSEFQIDPSWTDDNESGE